MDDAPLDAASPTAPPRGLTTTELALATAELAVLCAGATVVDLAILRPGDDLVLWLAPAADAGRKLPLHVVPGARRGRVVPTRRRFAKADFATGPHIDALRSRLTGATVTAADVLPGERIARVAFRQADGARVTLVAELFGNRGLWLLLDGEGRIVALSRLPHSKDRELRPGSAWRPPPAHAGRAEPPPRFAAPMLPAIDALFTAADEVAAAAELRSVCTHALARALTSASQKIAGLTQQLAQADDAPRLRAQADLMLAYAHTVPRGAATMRVPDPAHDGQHLDFPLQPDRPVVVQAQALYERARRLQDALAVTSARLDAATQARARLDDLSRRAAEALDFAALGALRDELRAHGLLPRERDPTAPPKPRPKTKVVAAENYRRFRSGDGADILCGKTNEQNDRLTRTARGNDVWLHIGRGYAGSHVVVRVQKGKSASLDTLLDAAAIAVHFSKARGADKAEVVYTQAKHVRKSKGAPAGAVVPHHTKTLFVRADDARLRRLLATGAPET